MMSSALVQANSRKRKPRSKASKTVKPVKTEDVMKSTSSDPSSDKRSDEDEEDEDEDDIEEKVRTPPT